MLRCGDIRIGIERMLRALHQVTPSLRPLLAVIGCGCGTMMHGTRQQVVLAIAPAHAEVSVYRWSGERVAGPVRPPGPLAVPRPKHWEPYLVVASAPDRCPRYWLTEVTPTTGRALSSLVPIYPMFGGGSLFEAVDDSTGGCCRMTDTLSATLEPSEACAE